MGRFDVTARRAAKREPAGFFQWVLPRLDPGLNFLGYVLVCALGTSSYFAFLGAGPHVVVGLMARTSAEYGLWFMLSAAAFMAGNFVTTRTVQRHGVDRMIAVGLVFLVAGGEVLSSDSY